MPRIAHPGLALACGAALAVALAVALAAPAHAGSTSRTCGNSAVVVGFTENNGGGTYDDAPNTCGVLGVRVNYAHIGGSSWTAWKYCAYGQGGVSQILSGTNPFRAQHSTSVGPLSFYSTL